MKREPVFFASIAAGAMLLLASACSSNSSSPSSYSSPAPSSGGGGTPAPSTVTISGSQFSPSTLTVTKGTVVTWKNNDGIKHTATSDNATWDAGAMNAGATASFTFSTSGTFPYHCLIHGTGMAGTIVVQ
jgi:plastocyanin